MNQFNTDEEIESVTFESEQQKISDVAFTPLEEETRKNLAEFYSPLFHKRFSRTQIYWLIFLAVGIFFTVKILFFVKTFAQEMFKYQTSFTEEFS